METIKQKKLVWLDCDPGIDDALAIYMLAYHPDLHLVGISTTFGNHNCDTTTKNTLQLLKLIGLKDVLVVQGAKHNLQKEGIYEGDFHGVDTLGGYELPETDQKAVNENPYQAIYDKIKSYSPQKIYFISIGCVTNLALLIQQYPDINKYIELISIMGGSIRLGNCTPSAEFNIFSDPYAAQIVFDSQMKIYLSPLDLTHKVIIDDELIDQIKSWNSKFYTNVAEGLRYYNQSYKKYNNMNVGFLHDPVAVYYVINPDAFKIQYLNVVVECQSQYCNGRTVIDINQVTERKPNVYVCLDLDLDQFWKCMLEQIKLCNQNCIFQ